MKLFTQALGSVLLIVALYVAGSFFFQHRVKNTVEDLIQQELDPVIEVKEVRLDGNYIFDKRRSGVADVSIRGEVHEVQIRTRGNGLWDDARVEIAPLEVYRLKAIVFFGAF